MAESFEGIEKFWRTFFHDLQCNALNTAEHECRRIFCNWLSLAAAFWRGEEGIPHLNLLCLFSSFRKGSRRHRADAGCVACQDVMGVALPDDTVPFDGVSLKPVIEDPSSSVKDVALSTFPRCSHEVHTTPTKTLCSSRLYAPVIFVDGLGSLESSRQLNRLLLASQVRRARRESSAHL